MARRRRVPNLAQFWAEVAVCHALQIATSPPPEPGDTLPRVRLRPVGRMTRLAIGGNLSDGLEDLYDPDLAARSMYKPAEDWQFMPFVPVRTAAGQWHEPIGHHRIQVPVREQVKGQWRIRCEQKIIRRGADLAALAETADYRRARFAEATGDWVRTVSRADYRRLVENGKDGARDAYAHAIDKQLREAIPGSDFDFDRSGTTGQNPMRNIDQEYVPLYGGSFNRQLYLFAHWEQTSKCFYERHHSDLAKSAVGIVSDFTLGRGVGWKIGDEDVAAIWQEFWDRNKMDARFRQLCEDLCWAGELMIRKYERPKGFLEIRSLDPGAFNEIVTDPQDVEAVYFYSRSEPQPWQLLSSFRGINLNIPSTQYVIQQYPPDEIYHVKLNVSATEKWGRSDFFASLGTLKRHRDWTNAVTLRDMLHANLVWDVKVTGDQADVDAYVQDPNNQTLPAFGGTFVHNDALTLEATHQDVTPRMGQGSVGLFLTALFATGQNMPLSYFNASTSGAARATALTQGEPWAKKVATRQQVLRNILDHLYQECMERAARAGRINVSVLRTDEADPEWIFPGAYEEDRGSKFRDLLSAREVSAISHQTMATQMAAELEIAEYDYDTEQEEIAVERKRSAIATWPIGTEVGVQLGVPPQGDTAPVEQGEDKPTDPTAATPSMTNPPGAPDLQSDDLSGRTEPLAGADARADFRRNQMGHARQSRRVRKPR